MSPSYGSLHCVTTLWLQKYVAETSVETKGPGKSEPEALVQSARKLDHREDPTCASKADLQAHLSFPVAHRVANA